LKLTPEQRSQISVASGTAVLAAFTKALDVIVLATLTPEQQTRLKQIELQQGGNPALLRDEIATQLKLTEEQKTAVRKLGDDAAAEARAAVAEIFGSRGAAPVNTDAFNKAREKSAEINKARDEKVLAVLSEEQRKTWQTMVGPKGPTVATFAGDRDGRGVPTDPAASAKTVFERYDVDKSGTITDAEFPETNRIRGTWTRAGVMLVFPVSREDFEKTYIKYLQGSRRRE